MIHIHQIKHEHQINIDLLNNFWITNDAVDAYDKDALRDYINSKNSLLLAAFENDLPVGLLLGTFINKPYKNANFLYIDEVDTHGDYRKKGIAKALMREAIKIAKERGACEIWLGTEPDNEAALILYRSLNPTEESSVIGFTYELSS